MGKYVSIDFGSRSVKVVAVDGSSKRFSLTHFAERELPSRSDGDAGVEVLVQAIEAMFAEMRLSKERVGVSIPAQDCFFREFYVPFTQPEQIAKIIKFEAENYLPSTPIEDLIIDYYPTAVEEGRTKVLVAACPKANVARILEALRRCEIDPPSIGLDITSLFGACQALGAIDGSTTCVLVDLGAQAMKIGLVEDGKLVHIRTPRVGTEILVEPKQESDDLGVLDKNVDLSEIDVAQLDLKALEKELIVSLSGFEDRREVDSEDEAAEKEGARRSALVVRMVREIVRTLAGRRLKSPAKSVLVAGGGTVLEGLLEDLSEKLQLEVVPIDVLGKVRHSLNGVDPGLFNHSLPVGLGVGLRQMGLETADFDLRKEEFRFARKFDQVRGILVVAVCALFCLALALCYLVKDRVATLQAINTKYVEAAAPAFGRAFDDHDEAKEVWDAEVRRKPEHLRLQSLYDAMLRVIGDNESGKPDDISALLVMRELTERIQAVVRGDTPFFLDFVDYREGRLTLKGQIANPELRSALMEELESSPWFPSYRYNGPVENKSPAPFDVTFQVVRPEEGE